MNKNGGLDGRRFSLDEQRKSFPFCSRRPTRTHFDSLMDGRTMVLPTPILVFVLSTMTVLVVSRENLTSLWIITPEPQGLYYSI